VKKLVIKSFARSLPLHINGEEKVNALKFFAEGAAKCGDDAVLSYATSYETCDVGVIIGNAFGANPAKIQLPHYHVRKTVIDTQEKLKKYWLSIDSNVFIYKDKLNPKKYLRYSFNGVFPTTGIYCNESPGEENWNNIKRDYNMDLNPWRTTGAHILITLQRPLGWSMRGNNLMQWLETTFTNIRRYSDRPIIIRWHPGDWKSFPNYESILKKYNATISPQQKHITEDLINCWALVCHNSTPSSVAVIEGIPAFITDNAGYCQAGEVSNLDFSKLEDPWMPDRDQWIKKLAQAHWSFKDTQSGRCWAHMRNWVKT
jgi:hypothetical protein